MIYIGLTIILILVAVLVVVIVKLMNVEKNNSITINLISTGMVILTSGILGVYDFILNLVYSYNGWEDKIIQAELKPLSTIIGFVLIGLGFLVPKYLNDKYYILNIHGQSKARVQKENNIKSLGLVDFKIREREINFINYFNNGKSIESVNSFILQDINEQVKEYINESTDYKKAYAGLCPLPYSVYSGTLSTQIKIDDYIDFNKQINSYKKLEKKKIKPVNLIAENDFNNTNEDVVFAFSTTKRIQKNQMIQFEKFGKIELYLEETMDNAITHREQVEVCVDEIIKKIELTMDEIPNLKRIHMLMATQSAVSFEFGRRIFLHRNRIPEIVVYHFTYENKPNYPFGIVVTEQNKGDIFKIK